MASAQTVPIEVRFRLLDATDPYAELPPLAGAKVRLVLGQSPDWQKAEAGRRFVTDAKGEAHFTMDGFVDTRRQSRNIGFTPLSWSSRT